MSSCGERRRLSRDTAGATAVEFALIVGLVIVLVMGTIQVGRALMARNDMSHALSEVVRAVHLDSTTTPEAIVAALEARLDQVAGSELAVAITEIAGTTYMRVRVEFPFRIEVPLVPVREVQLRVETLAPMVSPTVQDG